MQLNKALFKYKEISYRDRMILETSVVMSLVVSLMMFSGLRTTSIVIVGIAGFFAIMLSPLVGLCLLVFSIPLQNLVLITAGVTITQVLGLLLAVSFIVNIKLYVEGDKSKNFILLFYALFTLWCVFLLPFTFEMASGIKFVSSQVKALFFAIIIAMIPRNYSELGIVALSGLISVSLIGVYAVIFGMDDLTKEATTTGRLSIGDINENKLAFNMGVLLIVGSMSVFLMDGINKIYVSVALFFSFLSLLFTFSRTSYLAILASLLLYMVYRFASSWSLRSFVKVVIITIFVIGFLQYMIFSENLLGIADLFEMRVASIGDYSHDSSLGERLFIAWPLNFNVFLSSPIIGAAGGAEGYTGWSSHNDYLQVAAETGMVGIVLYLAMFGYIFYMLSATKDSLSNVIIALMFFILVFGLAHTTIHIKGYAYAIGIAACVIKLNLAQKYRFEKKLFE